MYRVFLHKKSPIKSDWALEFAEIVFLWRNSTFCFAKSWERLDWLMRF
jgi:hypothetical protein